MLNSLCKKLVGALIGLARATDGNEHLITCSSTDVIVEGLAAIQAAADTEDALLHRLMRRVEDEKRKMVPGCFSCANPCGKNSDYDMNNLRCSAEEVRRLKESILSCICDSAATVLSAAGCDFHDEEVERFFYKALIIIGMDDYEPEDLTPVAAEAKEIHRRSTILLEQANSQF